MSIVEYISTRLIIVIGVPLLVSTIVFFLTWTILKRHTAAVMQGAQMQSVIVERDHSGNVRKVKLTVRGVTSRLDADRETTIRELLRKEVGNPSSTSQR